LPHNARTVRRPILAVVLALLMLFAQHGAALHDLAHLWPAPTSGDTRDQSPPADAPCLKCLAFAQIGSSLGADPVALPLLEPAHERVGAPAAAVVAVAPPAARSRGPPTVL
jgi:hypothetical protein